MRRITSLLATYGAVVVPAIVAGAGFIEAVQPAGSTYRVKVTGVAGVPANAAAVVLNVTSAGATSAGFLTAWPCDGARPNSSNLNFGTAAPVANSAIVKVGTGGKVCIYTGDGATQLIADINGWFAGGSGYTSATPARLLDTRSANSTIDGQADGEGRRAAGDTYTLQVTGRGGVPGNASAVVLNLTADQPNGTGFVTAYPCGEGRPTASNLNFRVGHGGSQLGDRQGRIERQGVPLRRRHRHPAHRRRQRLVRRRTRVRRGDAGPPARHPTRQLDRRRSGGRRRLRVPPTAPSSCR